MSGRQFEADAAILKEISELSEEFNIQVVANQAFAFYLSALRLKQSGRIIVAVPATLDSNNYIVVDSNYTANYKLL